MHPPASVDPAAWGIDPGYHDVHGQWHAAPTATVETVLAALGAEPGRTDTGAVVARRPPPDVGAHVWVVRQGEPVDAGGPFVLRTEDGQELSQVGALPTDLPIGYHDLDLLEQERTVRLVVSPRVCPDPTPSWGWSVQLYGARSDRSWGIGDLGDLAMLARWSRVVGAGALLINPLHAAAPAGHQEPSPYYPASRVYRSPLFLDVPHVDGAAGLPSLRSAIEAGRVLRSQDLIDRDAVWALKRSVLEEAFARWEERGDPAAFAAYRAGEGETLDAWAAWCVTCDVAGADRSAWPPSLTPATLVPAVAADPELARGARFHAWLQWQIDRQLAAAAKEGPSLVTDLAIGCDAGGFDTWMWPEAFVSDVRVGAPPDLFAPEGQDWGLPPFDPWALRRLAFEPFARVVRAGMRHAGALRMDHVMGLFRLFVVPLDGKPADGCYLRYPASELLDILALEAHRAGAFVVGEDLGTVEPAVREELARRQVLGTKLLWFEDDRPAAWPEAALAAVTTHDLPTVAGAWTGADLDDQRDAGAAVADEAVEGLAAKLADWSALERDAPVDEAIAAAYRLLAESSSSVVLATLEDAVGQVRRPNLPGTVEEQRPNWCIPLPVGIEVLPAQPAARAIIDAMRHRPEP
jgi:4-alpha-glucanotransferase